MLIFLYGEDTYRSRKKLKVLKENFLKNQKGSFNLFHLTKDEVDEESLKKTISFKQLFGQKKLTVIEGPFSLSQDLIKKIIDFIEEIERDENNILILLEEKVEIKNLTPLAKEFFFKLKRLKHAQEFLPLPKFELKKFIKEKFLKEIAIEEKTLELLVEFLGNNLWLLENEINKLLSLKEKKKIIKEEEVKKLVLRTNQKIFDLIDAIALGNQKKALKLLEEQTQDKKEIEGVVSLLMRQFSLLLKIKTGMPLNLPLFVIEKLKEQEKKYSLLKLKKVYSRLLKLDFLRKTKPIDLSLYLNLLILKPL